ncbi:MAG: hypothetical protein AAFR61_21790 [Bacteroidota bacterium]
MLEENKNGAVDTLPTLSLRWPSNLSRRERQKKGKVISDFYQKQLKLKAVRVISF